VRDQFSFAANLFANTLRFDFMDALPPDCYRIYLIGARDFPEKKQSNPARCGSGKSNHRVVTPVFVETEETALVLFLI